MKVCHFWYIKSSLFVLIFLLVISCGLLAQPLDECENPIKQSTDFHAHTFNIRHLPVEGILLRNGLPRSLSFALASLFESVTPSILDQGSSVRDASASRAIFPPQEFTPEETTHELRSELIDLIGVSPSDMRAEGDARDMCGPKSMQDNDFINQVCRNADAIDDHYRNKLESEGFRDSSDESAVDLQDWLLESAVLSSSSTPETRSSFRPATTLNGLIDQAAFDLKVFGVMVDALSDSEPKPSSRDRDLSELPSKVMRGLRFLRILTSREDEIVTALRRDYCEIEKFVAHMMDLERGYAHSRKEKRNAPDISFEEQLKIYSRLKIGHPSLEFFGAYDPFQMDPNFTRAKLAMTAGAAGLKFYPPSGYRATRMEFPEKPDANWCWLPFWQPKSCAQAKQWDSRYGDLSKSKIRDKWVPTLCEENDTDCLKTLSDEAFFDQMNLAFFRQAASEDWILFSHHTPRGFEAGEGYGLMFADPCHWGELLQSYPELRDLKLVLAHSGGNGWSWQCDSGVNSDLCPQDRPEYVDAYDRFWKHAYNVCVSFENVYCDLGYHDAVLSDRGQSQLKKRLLQFAGHEPSTDNQISEGLINGEIKFCNYDKLAPPRYSIFDKLMYGSDWMMVVKEKRMEELPKVFDSIFTGDLAPYKKGFFRDNAERLLENP